MERRYGPGWIVTDQIIWLWFSQRHQWLFVKDTTDALYPDPGARREETLTEMLSDAIAAKHHTHVSTATSWIANRPPMETNAAPLLIRPISDDNTGHRTRTDFPIWHFGKKTRTRRDLLYRFDG